MTALRRRSAPAARRVAWLVIATAALGLAAAPAAPAPSPPLAPPTPASPAPASRPPPAPAIGPARSTTTLAIRVTDHGQPVAARVLLFDVRGQPLHMGNLDLYGQRQGGEACAIAPGVIGSWDGLILAPGPAEIPVGVDTCVPSPAIPYGRYRFVAWRGIEYERFEGRFDLSANRGRIAIDIPLERAWTPHGTLAADMHVHAFASNDSRIPNPQRVIAQAAAGIQVIGLSDHNSNGDVEDDIIQLGLTGIIASVASDELTSEHLHVGVYPVPVTPGAPYGGGPGNVEEVTKGDAQHLFALAHAMPGHPIVQLNHPRFRVTALFDGTGWDGVSWPPPFPIGFDAVEVLNGFTAFNVRGDRRFDEGARDFYTFIDHGRLLAPLGNSDTHDFNWVLDGTNRNYVFVDDPRTQPFDQGAFVAAIRSRRVVATSGPWLDVEVAAARGATPTVGPGEALQARGSVWLDVTVSQARFVHVDRLRVTVGRRTGPALARVIEVPRGRNFHWAGPISVGTSDTWLGVVADGDTPLPLEQTGSYQKDKWNHPGVTPFAIASPILIDADGDHRWSRNEANLPLP